MRHGLRAVAVRKYSKPALKQCSGQEEEILFQDIWWLKSTNTPAKLTGIDMFSCRHMAQNRRDVPLGRARYGHWELSGRMQFQDTSLNDAL